MSRNKVFEVESQIEIDAKSYSRLRSERSADDRTGLSVDRRRGSSLPESRSGQPISLDFTAASPGDSDLVALRSLQPSRSDGMARKFKPSPKPQRSLTPYFR